MNPVDERVRRAPLVPEDLAREKLRDPGGDTEAESADVATRAAIMGALSLYLNFINMFMLLLNLFGTTRE